MNNADTKTAAAFTNLGTFEGCTEWLMVVDGDAIGSMSRERPARYAAGARHGMVADRSAPWQWVADIDGRDVVIPAGSSVRQAKALMVACRR
jgi:hypothetical protein